MFPELKVSLERSVWKRLPALVPGRYVEMQA
jgi:hypothetical protein